MEHTNDFPTLREDPTYLTVRLNPNNLPSGAIDLHDLAQFLTGLQHTLDGKVRYDFGVEQIEGSRFAAYRFVIAEVRTGSVECDIIFNVFNNLHLTVNVGLTTEILLGGAEALTAGLLLKEFLKGAAGESGKAVVEPLRRYLREFTSFLRNVTSANPRPISSELLDKTEQGLKEMASVGAKPQYQKDGISISTKPGSGHPIVFDQTSQHRVLDLLEGEVDDGQTVRTQGKVTAIDIDQNTFRLLELGRGGKVRCRYNESQQLDVLTIARPPEYVTVDGVPHYRKGSDRTWPPLYLKVSSVKPMETLWNAGGGANSSAAE